MTVSASVSLNVWVKQGKKKKRRSSRDSPIHWVLDAASIGGMTERGKRVMA